MAENGNREPNDFRSRNGKRRREPPIIDAAATEIPASAPEPGVETAGAAPSSTDAALPVAEADPMNAPREPAEPVLFGGAMRDAASKPEFQPAATPSAAEPAEPVSDRPADPEVPGGQPPVEPPDAASSEHEDGASAPPAGDEDARPATASATMPPPTASQTPAARSGNAVPWILGVAVVALAAALGWVLYTGPDRSGRDEMAATLADLKSKVAALEARPDPAALQAGIATLDKRVAAADADRSALAKTVSGLAARTDAVKAEADKAAAAAASPPSAQGQGQGDASKSAPPSAEPAFAPLAAVTALSAKLDGLDTRVAGLAGEQGKTAKAVADLPKPVAPDFGPIDGKVAALDGRLTAIDGKVNGSDARLNDFDAKVNAVDGKINGFDARMNGLDVRMNGLEAKANDAAAQVGKLQSTMVAIPPLTAATALLDTKVSRIEGQLSAPKDGARVTEARAVGSADESKATPIALVGQSIAQAVADGRPYGADLDALKALGAEPEAIAALSPAAAKGAPTAATLKDGWAAVEGDVLAAVKPAETGSALDRFAASARALVQVRRVGAVKGDDPAALVTQVDAALGAGNVPAALAAWGKLPQAGQEASKAWAAEARGQVDAMAAAQGLVNHAIATLGRTKS